MPIDFRHLMCCQDCWGYFFDITSCKGHCQLDLQEVNRPDGLPLDMTRSCMMVYDSVILHQWPCEYRYTRKEIDQIRTGNLKGAHVTKAEATKIIEIVNSLGKGIRFDTLVSLPPQTRD